MLRADAIAACVQQMDNSHKFQAYDDSQKAKAAAYAFDHLHDEAVDYLPMGCTADSFRNFTKAATKRLHAHLNKLDGAQFEQTNGFPILLVLELIPLLWSWWKMLREWLGYEQQVQT